MLLSFRTADSTAVDAPRGGGVEADSLRVTLANDSTGVLSVDDNGGSLTVDNATISVVGGGTEATAQRVTIANDSTGVLSIDDNGGNISIDDGGNSITVDNTALSVVGGGTEATAQRVTIATDSTGVLSVDDNGSSLTVDNGGTFAVQVDGSALTALQLIDDTIIADDAAFTVGTTKVNVAGFFADQASTDSVNEGDVGAARMTLDRMQIVTTAPSADTVGVDTFRSADIDETEEEVKASAGKLYGWAVYNDHSAEVHLQFWNATAANTTPGTTTPLVTFPIAGGASAHIMFENGITFDTAICVGATAGFSDANAPGATVSGTIFYV